MGAVAKGFLIYEEMRKYLVMYDFATAPSWISSYIYEENLVFFFISVSWSRASVLS